MSFVPRSSTLCITYLIGGIPEVTLLVPKSNLMTTLSSHFTVGLRVSTLGIDLEFFVEKTHESVGIAIFRGLNSIIQQLQYSEPTVIVVSVSTVLHE